jgi:hypothetical protein
LGGRDICPTEFCFFRSPRRDRQPPEHRIPTDCLSADNNLSGEDIQPYLSHLMLSACATVLDCGTLLQRHDRRRMASAENHHDREGSLN